MINKLFLLLVIFCFSTYLFAQKKDLKNVSIDDFIAETQYSNDLANEVNIIWWIPTEYWKVVFANDDSVPEADAEAITDLLKEYLVVIAIKGKVGMFGGITYDTRETIQSLTKVMYKTVPLKFVDENSINPDLLNFLSIIKPMMKNLLGPMGENMQVFLFGNPEENNVLPVDVYSNETISFLLADYKEDVQLPLACLLEEKVCPEDNKLHSGKWKFCPFHGLELVSK